MIQMHVGKVAVHVGARRSSFRQSVCRIGVQASGFGLAGRAADSHFIEFLIADLVLEDKGGARTCPRPRPGFAAGASFCEQLHIAAIVDVYIDRTCIRKRPMDVPCHGSFRGWIA